MGTKLAVLALCLAFSLLAIGQTAPTEITNSDLISMAKAGIAEQAIVLTIQRGPVKFDTSPQALINLKEAGVSDQVLNAVLVASSEGKTSADAHTISAQVLFQKTLNAIGPTEKIAAIRSVRWKADVSVQGAQSFKWETVKVYPDRVYTKAQLSTGQMVKQVFTPEFSYRDSGTTIVAVPSTRVEAFQDQLPFDILSIAKHPEEYTVTFAGEGEAGFTPSHILKIAKSGNFVIWEVDQQTGRLLSARRNTASGDSSVEYSDWRLVSGLFLPFKRHTIESGRVSDYAITEYEVNPATEDKLFQRPVDLAVGKPQVSPQGQSGSSVVVCQEPFNCAHKFISGWVVKYITDNGIIVVATLDDTGHYCKADVLVINNSSNPVDLIPSSFSLKLTQPKEKELRFQPPEKVMTSVLNRAAWSNFFTALGAAGATQQSTTQTDTNGSVSVYGSGSYANGTFHGNSTSITSEPDEQARQNASNQIAANNAAASSAAQVVDYSALRATTIAPGRRATGSVFFERTRKMQEVLLSIPVNGRIYQFPFGW